MPTILAKATLVYQRRDFDAVKDPIGSRTVTIMAGQEHDVDERTALELIRRKLAVKAPQKSSTGSVPQK